MSRDFSKILEKFLTVGRFHFFGEIVPQGAPFKQLTHFLNRQ
jgi:hypothetical protein